MCILSKNDGFRAFYIVSYVIISERFFNGFCPSFIFQMVIKDFNHKCSKGEEQLIFKGN